MVHLRARGAENRRWRRLGRRGPACGPAALGWADRGECTAGGGCATDATGAAIRLGRVKRAGLLATQGIRGGANRETLKRIKETGDIFFAISDRDWVLDGANVHVSMVGFDDGPEKQRYLDSTPVPQINPELTATASLSQARVLDCNRSIAFMGVTPSGEFEVSEAKAREWLAAPNPSGKSNQDVLRPWVNGRDISDRSRGLWIIDFGCDVNFQEASQYEAP
ncbi:MAG: hypothetical protein ACPMAQ_12895 [Phycisphaerae bacterium]